MGNILAPMAKHSLLAWLGEDALCTALAYLPPASLAAFVQADRLRGASDRFWSGLTQAARLHLARIGSPAVALRSQSNPRRTFLRGLRARHERYVEACHEIASALAARDAISLIEKTLAEFPEMQEETPLRMRGSVPGGGTLLHVAAATGRRSCVRKLLQIGAQVDAQDDGGPDATGEEYPDDL